MKNYSLNIQPMLEFEGTSEYLGYFTKGHFDKERFVNEIIADWEPKKTPVASEVAHNWWRLVPAGDGSRAMLFKPAQAGARGAFPVTVWGGMGMKERPILMSAPMVRALLAGRKTQTRRIVKPQPVKVLAQPGEGKAPSWAITQSRVHTGVILNEHGNEYWLRSPYGYPGDRLWVRENFGLVPATAYGQTTPHRVNPDNPHEIAIYKAGFDRAWATRTRPAIHMPRWASRLTLEITRIRCEQVQSISETDARAEGVVPGYDAVAEGFTSPNNRMTDSLKAAWYGVPNMPCHTAYQAYSELWDSIHGVGAFRQNRWVWVVEFKVVVPCPPIMGGSSAPLCQPLPTKKGEADA